MARTTGEVIVDRLIDWGVDTIFGRPGDGINGIFEAIRVAQEKIHLSYRPEKPDGVRPALEAAFWSKKPAIVEATVDPFTPPMPAQATPEQGIKFAKGLLRGQPEAGAILSTVVKDKVRELT